VDAKTLMTGLVVGVLLGAGGGGAAWALTADNEDPVAQEVVAICDLVRRTATPTADSSLEDLRRWSGMNELMVSVAQDDPTRKPLADALQDGVDAMSELDFEGLRRAVNRVRDICATV
jgi:hypothetical protein